MSLIQFSASVINGVYSECNIPVAFSCGDNVASISLGYISRTECCGGKVTEQVKLGASPGIDANDVSGVVITERNGNQYFINGVVVADVQEACNTCCGETGSLDVTATAAYTPASDSDPFCLTTTTDDGTAYFVQQLMEQYYGRYDITKGFSRFTTNKFTFYTTDALASIVPASGHSVAAGACA